MEHRYGNRTDVDLRATVVKSGVAVGRGKIKNGSSYGFFLETDYADVNVLQKLVIEVVLHSAPQTSVRYELSAIVVRRSEGGLGLELETVGARDSVVMAQLIDAVRNIKSVTNAAHSRQPLVAMN